MNEHNERAELPPLPAAKLWHDAETGHWKKLTKPDRPTYEPYYTADQMREYARAAMLEAQPAEQANGREPVGAVLVNRDTREGVMFYSSDMIPDASTLKDRFELVNVYTTPPAQPALEWVSLTDDEKLALMEHADGSEMSDYEFMDAIESKLREKNAVLPAQPAEKQPFGHLHTHQWIMRDGKEICLRCDAVKGGAL